ncbi:hypothetical protein [Paenibacillus durus]|uniref:Uncharacterized protein n=1 Tax=Paenibacillus durus TaxID=44251 RepID=A0A089IYS1_PAEDU|nr:hypothetical protein [Paenibacillus durus]AIQ14094.1 hypothetical protein PDUR_20890 [Paenibacillus durus]
MKYHRAVARIKRTHDWSIGERRVVRADTTLIFLKKQMSLFPIWFIAPFLIALAVMFYAWRSSGEFGTVMNAQATGITLLFFLLSLAFRRMRTKEYSADSTINEGLNRAQRRYWSALFLAIAILDAVFAAAATLSGLDTWTHFGAIWQNMTAIQVASPFAVAWYTDHKINEWSKRLHEADGHPFYTDDDEYWRLGGLGSTRAYIFKHSPPYIVIRLVDEYIVFNDKEASDTRRTFEDLRRKVPHAP